jgi:hypothetical protein
MRTYSEKGFGILISNFNEQELSIPADTVVAKIRKKDGVENFNALQTIERKNTNEDIEMPKGLNQTEGTKVTTLLDTYKHVFHQPGTTLTITPPVE